MYTKHAVIYIFIYDELAFSKNAACNNKREDVVSLIIDEYALMVI